MSIPGPVIIVLVGAIISAFGVTWSSVQQAASDAKSEKKSEELATKNEELVKKTEQIAALNEKINSTMTGGEGFCYVTLADLGRFKSHHEMSISVTTDSDYPQYDVKIAVVDMARAHSEKDRSYASWEKYTTHYDAGNVTPHSTRYVGGIAIDPNQDSNLSISIFARNGTYYEYLRMRKGQTAMALRVVDSTQNKTLMEKVDPSDPLINGFIE